MKYMVLLFCLYSFAACKNQGTNPAVNIFETKLEHHLISSGDNRPDFNPYKDSVDYFLYALHTGMSPEAFAEAAGWTDSVLQKKIQLLQNSGFLNKADGEKLVPPCMVITQETGKQFYTLSENVAQEIAISIKQVIPVLKKEYSRFSFSGKYSFDTMSFFLLSDVLLDNWQINNVEKEFVQASRTPRHGKNYFYQVAELRPNDSIEVFGIYGNQVQCNDSFCVAVYGNRRSHVNLGDYFSRKDLPFITPGDEELFKTIANFFKPTLIHILQQHKTEFEDGYKRSVYSTQISFAEYFMWFYHFIYTKAIDVLNQDGIIHIPADGNFFIQEIDKYKHRLVKTSNSVEE
jgi:hypothetical protein